MFFGWLRKKIRDTVLGGVADALRDLDDDADTDTQTMIDQLRGEAPALVQEQTNGHGRRVPAKR